MVVIKRSASKDFVEEENRTIDCTSILSMHACILIVTDVDIKQALDLLCTY